MKVILWFQTPQLQLMNNAINIVGQKYGALDFVGTYAASDLGEISKKFAINGQAVPPLDKNDLQSAEYDIIIVGGANASMPAVLNEAKQFDLDPDKIVLDRTVCVPGFSLENYKLLRHSQLSIIAQNCWGGLMYHLFGLQFTSPTVNMFFDAEEFVRMMSRPQRYFDNELRLLKTAVNDSLKITYPVMLLGDVQVFMNHYSDFNAAREKWERRRLKINWYNTLVGGYTDKREILEQFDQLPFSKKVCFVPFETELGAGWYIPPKLVHNEPFWKAVNMTAHNIVRCYNLWDMLLYGKKTPIYV